MKANTPCHNCKEREPPECHITCPRYEAFRNKKDAEMKRLNHERLVTDTSIRLREQGVSRIYKKKGER